MKFNCNEMKEIKTDVYVACMRKRIKQKYIQKLIMHVISFSYGIHALSSVESYVRFYIIIIK